ncbi:hypothetical protein LTR78_007091 [Recurvomyces mirabilis]|uniref:Uncharacterized protein n=1 Tax=Recurvomyces mirabilis TaxID=574656 RepID=A0AAE0WJQ6_9PEZI|nr:hypothetical protein LTR78_007091 [Recurvomyces mirabilis]KAK5150938.1 hypothetical protein LTS14_009741 [Recurvomyces mirabilis]
MLYSVRDKALVGIDLLSFTTTPRFRGVKTLPPGLHFTFVGSSTAFSERHGIWFRIKQGANAPGIPIFIAKWDCSTETLQAVTDQAEQLRWRANLGSIWQEGLTPYRQTTAKDTEDESEELVDWSKLTSHISDKVLSRITGSTSDSRSLSSGSSSKRDLEHIPGLSKAETELQTDQELNFLPVELKQTWRQGATGRERTEAAQDRSWALSSLINEHCTDALEVVGELQFCFLMVLTLNNYSCLEQWKRLLNLLFTCHSAVVTRSQLFIEVIRALLLQLQHCKVADSGLIDLADEGGSLLKHLLVRFRKGLQGLGTQSSIGVQDMIDELDDLEEYLRTEHGWQFGGTFAKSGFLEMEDGEQVHMDSTAFDEDDETGEYAPQIVDLTPEQARLLNVGGAEDLHHSLSKTSLVEAATEESDDDVVDEEEAEKIVRSQISRPAANGHASDSEEPDSEEETDDLDDMDARY